MAVSGGIVLSLYFFETWPRRELRLVTLEPSFSSWSWISWWAISAQACMKRSRSGARTGFLPPFPWPGGKVVAPFAISKVGISGGDVASWSWRWRARG